MKKKVLEERLIASMRQAVAIHKGERRPARHYALPVTARHVRVSEPSPVRAADIVALRERLNWSQAVLAKVLNVGVKTVQSWEQGVRLPAGSSARLLDLARRDAETFESLVGSTVVLVEPPRSKRSAESGAATQRQTDRRRRGERAGKSKRPTKRGASRTTARR